MGRKKIQRTSEYELLKKLNVAKYQQEYRRKSKDKFIGEKHVVEREVESDIIIYQKIIRGTINQGDDRFTELSRGKQCTAIAVVAAAMSTIMSPISWTSKIIDNILTIGDQFYVDRIIIRNTMYPHLSCYQYLAASELEQSSIVINSSNFDFRFGDIISGHVYYDNDEIGLPNLKSGLFRCLEHFRFAIFTSNGISLAVGKYGDLFWIFDSHSNDEHGVTACDGTACLITFSSVTSLWLLLSRKISSSQGVMQQYDLTPITGINRSELNASNISSKRNVPQVHQAVESISSPTKRRKVDRRARHHDEIDNPEDVLPYPILLQDRKLINLDNNYQIKNRTATTFDDNGQHYAGPMNVLCKECGAKHFNREKVANKRSFGDCCAHGEVRLDNLPNPPHELQELFENKNPKSKEFFNRIRHYNNSLSFASFNANLTNLQKQRPGPYCFKIQGQIYYQINTALYPENHENPSYGQLFIIDSQEALSYRLEHNSDIDEEIMKLLDTLIRENNIFAQSYRMMADEIRYQQQSVSTNGAVPELHLCFTLKPGQDQRRFNSQRCNEVAAVFSTSANGEVPESYVTIRDKNTKLLQKVSSVDPNVEPWIYPLFYPYGSRGWHPNLMRVNRNAKCSTKRVSRAAYIKYRLAIRNNEFNVFVLGRRLFQQWIVDNYVKVEQDRIKFCADNQKTLRSETYQGLIDYLESVAHDSQSKVGKITVLPSTFIGSPRNMMQHYQDSMAIVRKFGKPDLFITMTCNPKWREIDENLWPGQQTADRPDLCARVFHLKKEYLIDLIVKQQFFGEVLAYVYVIEFQKRGLPHMHLLLTLKHNYKITTAEIIDRYISAEIPDEQANKVLHNIIIKNMIHGPCGDWCIVNQKCSKHYPKEFSAQTIIDADGYPKYRRRNTGKCYERYDGYKFDNRYVVPHCPDLIQIFNCHMNVEIVSSISAVKYLYKYIYKGHDAASINIKNNSDNEHVINHNEIRDFIEARYVGPVEASWRILSKHLQDKSHTVIRLPVHLPNEQNILISDGNTETAIVSAIEKVNMLIDYFKLNIRDELAGNYYYTEIPLHYVFKKCKINNQTVQRWERRKIHFKCIGRMYSVSPAQTELFHLRLLLLSVKNAKSFEDLRTVSGIMCQTYQSACLQLGLIEDDDEWTRAMDEAVSWMMPQGLRKLFVRILIHCQPNDPQILFEKFKQPMSEDFSRRVSFENGLNKLAHISTMFDAEGLSIHNFLNIEPVRGIIEFEHITYDEANTLGMQQYAMMNERQKSIVDDILKVSNDIEQNNCKAFYIDGSGGSGKTFIYTTLWYLLQGMEKKIITMAFTGIAATLLPEGKTVHKTFGLPVPLYDDSTSNIKAQSKEAEIIRNTDIFMWDEAPMAPRYALEIIDRTLRDFMNVNIPFGGKILILGGDFRQLLPIKQNGTRSELIDLSIKFSPLWKYFKKYYLIQNMRALPEEIEFSSFLLEVGDGKLNDADDNIILPKNSIIDPMNGNLVTEIFAEYFEKKQYEKAAQCVILSARNVDVEEINRSVINLLKDYDEKVYTSVDSVENCGDKEDINIAILPEYLNSLSPPSLPPHELRLKVHSIIILMRNLSIYEGLCNGTRLLILELGNHLLKCKILTGDKSGETVFINRVTLYCENVYPFTFKRRISN